MFSEGVKCTNYNGKSLTLSCGRSLSYKNQSIDLQSKSLDWFLYGRYLRHEKVNIKMDRKFGKEVLH